VAALRGLRFDRGGSAKDFSCAGFFIVSLICLIRPSLLLEWADKLFHKINKYYVQWFLITKTSVDALHLIKTKLEVLLLKNN